MSGSSPAGRWERLASLARAADGDPDDLGATLSSPDLSELAVRLGLGSALALAAERGGAGDRVPVAWKERLRSSATVWMFAEETARRIFAALEPIGGRWAPIKGFDVGTRYYTEREERPIGDLDLLVEAGQLEAAVAALTDAGWDPMETSRRARQFVRQEGYTCHFVARPSAGVPNLLVEVHFRLWGMVPVGLESDITASAVPAPDGLGPGWRIAGEHAYLLAAIHAWTRLRPRDLSDWRDLQAVLAADGEVGCAEATGTAVIESARRWSLELPVCLSAEVAARLWPGGGHDRIVEGLEPGLTRGERRLLERLRHQGIESVALSSVVLARLRAGRPSRSGWRSVWRHLWAHPGMVELETPAGWSWPRRRLKHLMVSISRA